MTARTEVTNPLLDTSGFDENIDEPIRTAITFDATGFPSGSYDYRLEMTSNFFGGTRRSRFVDSLSAFRLLFHP